MQFPANIMQIWKSSDATRTVGILLFDAFSNLCLANAVEPLRAANTLSGKPLYRWSFLSLDGDGVVSSSGLPVQPHAALGHERGDYLFVMPSYRFKTHATPACHLGLRAAQSRYRTLVGMDMGSWLLASSGLLDGHTATIHWDELVHFAETFPAVHVTEDRFVLDGPILSCGGATTTFELVLKLIEQHHGPMLALEVSALFMFGEKASWFDPQMKATRAGKLRMAAALMRRNIEVPVAIPDIAQRIGLPEKSLSKLCNEAYGFGPARLYQAIRLREARRLCLNTGFSVEEISARCGYTNASALTRAFRREFGITPRELRMAGREVK